MDIDVRTFSDFKNREAWISWLGPSSFIFSLWIINIADWILGGPIGKSIVQGFPEVSWGLSILGMPALWFIWPSILLGKLWWRKSWLVREAPALQYCRLTRKDILPIQVYLQSTAIILGLVWSTFGLFTWLVNENALIYLHEFNAMALTLPNFLAMIARSLTCESRTMNKFNHFILTVLGPKTSS